METIYTISSNKPNKIETISIIPGITFIDLSWNTPFNSGINITSYLIKKSVDLSNWVDLSSTTTSFRVSNLLNDTKYYFKVIARNNNGFGPESNIFTATLIRQVTPGKIETISIIPGNTFIDLSWNTPYNGGIDITSYLIQKSTDLSNWVDLSSTTTTFRASNLLNDTKYYFIVRARNNIGLGPESNIFTETPIRQVTNILPTVTSSSGTSSGISSSISSGISSISSGISSSISSDISSGGTTPSKIEIISTIAGNTFIDLSWNTPYNGGIDITNYLIQKSLDSSNWVDISSTTTSFRASNLSNDTKYYFKVRARNNVGLGTESNIFIETPKIVETPIPITSTSISKIEETPTLITQILASLDIASFDEILKKYNILYVGLAIGIIFLFILIILILLTKNDSEKDSDDD